MEIKVERKVKSDESTIGVMSFDGVKGPFTLEDKDRGLTQNMSYADLVQTKVFGKTAIPAGRYEVVITFSNRFQRPLPLLLNVPNWEGVRIHPGNKAEDTEGCILVGRSEGINWIGESRASFEPVLAKIHTALLTEKVFITIG